MSPWSPWDFAPNFFDDDPFDSYGSMWIHTHGRSMRASRHVVNDIFPGLTTQFGISNIIETEELAEWLYRYDNLRNYNVSRDIISAALRSAFRVVSRMRSPHQPFSNGLIQKLQDVLQSRSWRYSGLSQCRRHFHVLALFANRTASGRLASALVKFFCAYGHSIVASEHSSSLYEWGVAINELQGLVSSYDFDKCMSCFSRNRYDYDRGRRFDMPRPRTVPPMRRHHSPALLLPPAYEQSLVPLSPPVAPMIQYPVPMTNRDQLQYQINRLEGKVNSLERDVMEQVVF